MIPKVSCLLLISLAYLLMQSCEGQNWRAFQNKHIDYPMPQIHNPNAYCSLMMLRRGMTRYRCKPVNTFIDDTTTNILDICRNGGFPSVGFPPDFFESRNRFNVLQCDILSGSPPNCLYRGNLQSNRLRVRCDTQRQPIHLEPVLP